MIWYAIEKWDYWNVRNERVSDKWFSDLKKVTKIVKINPVFRAALKPGLPPIEVQAMYQVDIWAVLLVIRIVVCSYAIFLCLVDNYRGCIIGCLSTLS